MSHSNFTAGVSPDRPKKRSSRNPIGLRGRLGRFGSAVAIGSGLVLILGACSTPAEGGDAAASDGSGVDGKQISYVSFGQQYEFIVGLTLAITEKLEGAGATVTVLDGRSDPNLQTTQVQDSLAKQPDALIIDPVDPTLMITGFEDAAAQGVPVFAPESRPDDVEYTGWVGYDSIAAGAMGADTLAGLVGEKGTVLQLRGAEASQQAQLRKKGFDDQMAAKYPNITVQDLNTEWTAENANSMVLDAFTANPDIVGIWSHNDEMLRGAFEALDVLKLNAPVGEEGHIAVVGHDGTPLALERIRTGVQDATVAYDAIGMGNEIGEKIIAYFAGDDFEQDTILQPYLVDESNVDDENHWGNLPALQ
ncbi:sugar ABC transporter substrate-binding protein [Cryobacterium glaciale]|uniref:Sugar ABC transporter substrate-binding protein n=1 Tax=Cryobacterium glaciale TaxID=1259145 RepID=A0A4R8UZT1_9MICO|nr:sugar ABC transporter substrate-binding protein [Cryobacterium glaciale]TFB74997.1 sugar ABC transporter substrate-binding protein [Cryobacterium glaciale]